nr:chemotaxis protein CheW [uncultured Rhodoferax sp.]
MTNSTEPFAPTDSGQYLSLYLGSEEYAINILRVQEIRSYEAPTKLANSPSFVKGVINLRGAIVPIVDLRLKLQLASVAYNELTVVIFLNLGGTVVGVVVDGVSDVVTLDAQAIQPAPQFESALESRFIVGLATLGERMMIVMNMDALMGNVGMPGVLV